MPDYKQITSRCFINLPFTDFFQYQGIIIDQLLQPEIGLEGEVLDTASADDFRNAAGILKKHRLRCTLHAPFGGLLPGAADRSVLQATRRKLKKAFELIPLFEPASIVCHLGYETDKDGPGQEEWFATSLETWEELLAIAEKEGALMMLENTYETGPGLHDRIFRALDSTSAGFCLDVGHVNTFARNTWQDWLPALEPWLGQLHLHDNNGDGDRHLAPGQGSFDFKGLFDYLRERQLHPIMTLEPHSEETLWESLKALNSMKLF